MAYLARMKSGNYTDSDVKAFYIEKRFDFGPFIREVGDFIAHPMRNKGNSFDAVIGVYSQVSFFQRYQGTNPKPLNFTGDCEWWLKPYLNRKLESYSQTELKKNLKISKAELKNKIDSWFPGKDPFPKKISATNPFEFYEVVNFFSRLIAVKPAFQIGRVRRELKESFKKNNVASVNPNDFLIGTATILNGMRVELAEGVIAMVSIGVNKKRYTRMAGGDPELLASGGYLSIAHPDGPLDITIQTETPKEHNLVDISITLLETEIDTEPYFDRSLIHYQHPHLPHLNLEQNLQFVSNEVPKITAC